MSTYEDVLNTKRDLDKKLSELLNNFTKETGLPITDIDINRLEMTNFSDKVRVWGDYMVETTIEIKG